MKKLHILLIFVFMTSVLAIKSQDKYEFTIIEYSTYDGELSMSKDGLQFGKEKVEVGSGFNANPLLAKVKEFQEKGWEVMSFQTLFAGNNSLRNNEVYFAYMRRKKDK